MEFNVSKSFHIDNFEKKRKCNIFENNKYVPRKKIRSVCITRDRMKAKENAPEYSCTNWENHPGGARIAWVLRGVATVVVLQQKPRLLCVQLGRFAGLVTYRRSCIGIVKVSLVYSCRDAKFDVESRVILRLSNDLDVMRSEKLYLEKHSRKVS